MLGIVAGDGDRHGDGTPGFRSALDTLVRRQEGGIRILAPHIGAPTSRTPAAERPDEGGGQPDSLLSHQRPSLRGVPWLRAPRRRFAACLEPRRKTWPRPKSSNEKLKDSGNDR